MKWLLIFISLSVSDNTCDSPGTLIKHGDELYDSRQECEAAFKVSTFYKNKLKREVVGFCLGPLQPLMLSPKQQAERIDYPKCN